MGIRRVSPLAQPQRSGGRTKLSAGTVRNPMMHNVPGTKLVKRFIKQASGEAHSYRLTLSRMLQYIDGGRA